MSLAVELDLGRVERFLALAWESGATCAVVVGVSRVELVGAAVPAALLRTGPETALGDV